MAYEKQTWTCGDTITADKLNHIEEGIDSNSPMIIEGEWNDTTNCLTVNCSYNDVLQAINDEKQIATHLDLASITSGGLVPTFDSFFGYADAVGIYHDTSDNLYKVYVFMAVTWIVLSSETPDGSLQYCEGGSESNT